MTGQLCCGSKKSGTQCVTGTSCGRLKQVCMTVADCAAGEICKPEMGFSICEVPRVDAGTSSGGDGGSSEAGDDGGGDAATDAWSTDAPTGG
jgi:hypothetical protein